MIRKGIAFIPGLDAVATLDQLVSLDPISHKDGFAVRILELLHEVPDFMHLLRDAPDIMTVAVDLEVLREDD